MRNKQINFIGWILLSSPRLDLSSPPSEAFGRWWDRYFFLVACLVFVLRAPLVPFIRLSRCLFTFAFVLHLIGLLFGFFGH